jgi:hypothetical protein
VRRVPLLPVHNRFACLEIENELPLISSISEMQSVKATPENPPSTRSVRTRAWEKKLPKCYIVAAVPSSKSLIVKIEIQSTDTGEIKSGPALIDCGATGQFMDRAYVERNRLTTRKLLRPIPVYNVDGTLNEAGSITEIVDVILRFNDHSERTSFAVTNLGKQDVILGFTWLKEHNPEINWNTGEVLMSRCPDKCHTCRTQVQEERKALRKTTQYIRACRSGPHPEFTEEDTEGKSEGDSDPEDALREGDRLYYVNLPPESEFI